MSDTPTRGAMSRETAEEVWSILVRAAGASPDGRDDFVFHQTRGFVDEYRFCGALGFGGKFWRSTRRTDEGTLAERWYVNGYPEDQTPQTTAAIERTNEALAAVRVREHEPHYMAPLGDDALTRLLRATATPDGAENGLWWRQGFYRSGTDLGLRWLAPCNDVFAWGCFDAEPIESLLDVEALGQALSDAVDAGGTPSDGYLLYCGRRRNLRPQGAIYKYLTPTTWALFDDCGPARQVGPGNPHPRPDTPPPPADTQPRFSPEDRTLHPGVGDPLTAAEIRRVFEPFQSDDCDLLRWTVDPDDRLRIYVGAYPDTHLDRFIGVEVDSTNLAAFLTLITDPARGADTAEAAAARFIQEHTHA